MHEILTLSQPAEQAGSIDVRTLVSNDRDNPPEAEPQGFPVGYSFDPVPTAIRRDARLKAIDHCVLAILVSFATWRRDSCWTTMKIISQRLAAIRPGRSHSATACERTAQRSIDRLKATGYIRHERVPKPDPDQPDNRTGWRFFFNFSPIQPPREVTKAPREVTKEIVAGDLGTETLTAQVTSESPDSIVTQFRGEEREPEKNTLDASGSRPSEEETPTMGTDGRPMVWTPRELATDLLKRVRSCGHDLRVERDGSGGARLRDLPVTASVAAISPELGDEIKSRRDELIALLEGARDPNAKWTANPTTDQSAEKAPRVSRDDRQEIPKAIAGLGCAVCSASDVERLAHRLAKALGPHEDEEATLKTFRNYCWKVRRSEWPESVLQDAFEVACSKGKRNRGAVFVALVKKALRLISAARGV